MTNITLHVNNISRKKRELAKLQSDRVNELKKMNNQSKKTISLKQIMTVQNLH